MKYEIIPSVTINNLQKALQIQFGEDFIKEVGDLTQFLFGDNFMDGVFILFFIDDEDEDDETQKYYLKKCIKVFLRDSFPNYSYVLIDVSW